MPPPRLPPSNSASSRSHHPAAATPSKKKRRNSQIPRTVKSTLTHSVLLPPTPTGAKSVPSSFSPSAGKGNNIVATTRASTTTPSPMEQKVQQLHDILSQPEIDLWALRELCLTDGGLVNDDIRKKAWPKLVGIVHSKQTPTSSLMDSKPQLSTIVPTSLSVISPESVSSFKNTVMASCLDAVQISLDTARCTWHLLNGTQRANKNTMRNKHKKRVRALLKRKQRRLGNFINLTLIRTYNEHTKLRYYQGYHDVSCIILSVLGGETTVPPLDMDKHLKTVQAMATKTAQAMGLDLPSEVLAKLSHSHFVDLMKDNFEHLTKALRLIVFPLIACLDPEVHQHLIDCDMEPFFCLSWIITWFSHDVRDTAVVKRLFDFFIASHPIMPVYLSIAMVLHPVNRMEVLGSGCDFASLHRTLSQLPMNSCSVGWKFIGSPAGGEYVSGEEEDDDSCSFDGSIVSQDVYREEGGGGGCGDDDSLAPSLTSESMLSGCCDSSRVPFQEVMDMAINFMRRIPPRTLIRLAHRYYDSVTIQHLAGNVDKINMLQQPPEWATSSTIMSDDAAKRLYRSDVSSNDKDLKKEGLSQDMKYLYAVIAAGIGPDGDGDAIKRKKRRKMLRTSAIFVGIASILLGMIERQVLISPFRLSITKADANHVGSSFRRTDVYPQHFKSPVSNNKNEENVVEKLFDSDISTFMDFFEIVQPHMKDSFHMEELDVNLNLEAKEILKESETSLSQNELEVSGDEVESTSAQILASTELIDAPSSEKINHFKSALESVQNNKLKPTELGQEIYKGAKIAIKRVDPNAIRQFISSGVANFAKNTKEVLAREADILLL